MEPKGRSGFVYENWSKTFSCKPKLFFQPHNVKELKSILRKAKVSNMKVKVVGGGISPSDIACTSDYMISMENFNRVLAVDEEKNQVTVEAGVLIEELNCDILPRINMALSNQASVPWQSVAGMIGTGSHGTGAEYGSFSSFVLAINFMRADGTVLKCSAKENPDLFEALKCHLGILGIILDLTLQCEPAFDLMEIRSTSTLQGLLSSLDQRVSSSEYFRFFWFPHTDCVTTYNSNRTKQPSRMKKTSWFRETVIGYHLLKFCLWLSSIFPVILPFINRIWFNMCYLGVQERVSQSYEVFNINCLFRQHVTEWAIARKYTSLVLTQMKEWLDCNPKVKAHFPVEVRFVKKDDVMMTPSGDEDVTYIGIVSYRPYGKDVERKEWWEFFQNLVMKYRGKPHWAKANKANAEYLRRVYSRFDEFMAIRERLDPERMFVNEYWMRIMDGN